MASWDTVQACDITSALGCWLGWGRTVPVCVFSKIPTDLSISNQTTVMSAKSLSLFTGSAISKMKYPFLYMHLEVWGWKAEEKGTQFGSIIFFPSLFCLLPLFQESYCFRSLFYFLFIAHSQSHAPEDIFYCPAHLYDGHHSHNFLPPNWLFTDQSGVALSSRHDFHPFLPCQNSSIFGVSELEAGVNSVQNCRNVAFCYTIHFWSYIYTLPHWHYSPIR